MLLSASPPACAKTIIFLSARTSLRHRLKNCRWLLKLTAIRGRHEGFLVNVDRIPTDSTGIALVQGVDALHVVFTKCEVVHVGIGTDALWPL